MTRLLTYLIANCRNGICKVPGSSLFETVVSLTILLSILTLSFTRIDRINHSLNPQVLYKAHLIASLVIQREDLLVEQTGDWEMDGFKVEKSIELEENGLCRVEIRVFNRTGRLVHKRSLLKANGIEL